MLKNVLKDQKMTEFHQKLQCPYCRTEAVLFSGYGFTRTKAGTLVMLTCGYCGEAVISKLTHDSDEYIVFSGNPGPFDLDDTTTPVLSVRTIPEPETVEAPADCPSRIANAYKQAVVNLAQGHYETCVILCGRALDLATKEMDPTWKLEKRLKKLSADNRITANMADWAHEIRLDRNIAAHEEHDFSRESAEEILGFTEAFLNYVYTLPALIERRRAVREVNDVIGN